MMVINGIVNKTSKNMYSQISKEANQWTRQNPKVPAKAALN